MQIRNWGDWRYSLHPNERRSLGGAGEAVAGRKVGQNPGLAEHRK